MLWPTPQVLGSQVTWNVPPMIPMILLKSIQLEEITNGLSLVLNGGSRTHLFYPKNATRINYLTGNYLTWHAELWLHFE